MSKTQGREIRVGTRGSPLALRQTEWVAEELRRVLPDRQTTLIRIRTKGDIFPDGPLWQMGGKGFFVKEIEEALLAGQIDMAVHSMKDLPTDTPPGLFLGAITAREDPRDCLLSRDGLDLEDLPEGSVIGTSSLRRQAQLRDFRMDLQFRPLRGNLDTRIRKLNTEGLDAILLAAAGLHRLGVQGLITQYIPTEICLPAAGQGSLGVEVREEDEELLQAVRCLHHPESAWSVVAERSFLKGLGGGCQIPIGALGQVQDASIRLRGMVSSPQGDQIIRGEIAGPMKEGERLGGELANRLWPRAKEILKRQGA